MNHKRRGRKPKGGKLLKKHKLQENNNTHSSNIILHLKIKSLDLQKPFFSELKYNPIITTIESYDTSNSSEKINKKIKEQKLNETQKSPKITKEQKIIEKIKKLNIKNDNASKLITNCFWCSFPFKTPPIHIPSAIKYHHIESYGYFCCPECAAGYLCNEHLDASIIWERYALLNNVYKNIFEYEENIKPAPNPFFVLTKYGGNLEIEEFRQIIKKKHIILTSKPIINAQPELYIEKSDIYPNFLSLHQQKLHDKTELLLKRKHITKKTNFF